MTALRSALVVGATGFIGSAVVRRLLAEEIEAYCLVRRQSLNRSVVEAIPRAEIIEIPSFEPRDLKRALSGIPADVVFNFAAYGVNQQDRDPEAMLEGNAGLVARLLLVTSDWPLKRFIHTGSSSEYGLACSRNAYLSESESLRPMSLYGAAKAASVIYGNALAARLGAPFVTLRLFGVFGIGDSSDRLIPYLIQRLQHDQPVDLTPGDQVRDMLYVDDVVDAFLLAATSDRILPYQAYNVCSGKPIRVREIGEAVANEMKKPRDLLRWGSRPYRQDEAMWVVGDNRRFTDATCWRPKIGLADGVRRMLAAAVQAGDA